MKSAASLTDFRNKSRFSLVNSDASPRGHDQELHANQSPNSISKYTFIYI